MRRLAVGLVSGFALLGIIGAVSTIGLGQTPQVIRMTVKKFEYSVKEVVIKKGVPVIIEITSEDRVHGFSLPSFGVRGDVNPGETTRISFTPDKAGVFEYLCDVFCGEGHEDVSGKLIVTE